METSRLAAIPLFADLDDADLAAIAAAAVELETAEGETLATQGDLGHAMFAIESGTVEVRANGKQVATLGAGDVFGEVAVLAAGIRMATVVATSPVRLIGLLKRDVWALERRSPETAARLRELIAKRLDFGRACPILFAQMCRSSQQEGTAASAAPSKRHDHPSPGTRSGCRERSRCTARSPGRVRCAVRRSSDSGPGQRGGAHGRPLLRRRAPSPGADAGGRAP